MTGNIVITLPSGARVWADPLSGRIWSLVEPNPQVSAEFKEYVTTLYEALNK